MNTIDIIIAVLLIIGFVQGIFKGLFVEVASLLSLLLGIYVATHFSHYVGGYLSNWLTWEERYIKLASFAITFLLVVLGVALLGKLFTKVADAAALGMLNKILGGAFGALKYALIISIIFLLLSKIENTFPIIPKEQKENSILYQPVKKIAPLLFSEFFSDDEAK